MPKITLGITGLHEILDWYHMIDANGDPHLIAKRESVYIRKQFNYHRNSLGHQHDHCLIVLDTNMGEVTLCENDALWVLNFGKAVFCRFLRWRFQQANVKRGIEFRDQVFSNSVKKSELNFKIS